MKAAGVRLVTADWVAERTGSDDFLLLDPRSPVRYLSGHIASAVSVPWTSLWDGEGNLRPAEELADRLGAAGLDDRRAPVVYDGVDGRHGAMLAWILVYLGRSDAHLMDVFFETWQAEGREVYYRRVEPVARGFRWRRVDAVRASREEVLRDGALRIDFRGADEFSGETDTEGRPGHIPGARHLAWQELGGGNGRLLAPAERLVGLLKARGIAEGGSAIAYCRSGPRAALGFLALRLAGRDVRLYDGSYADWVRSGLPVETGRGGPAGRDGRPGGNQPGIGPGARRAWRRTKPNYFR
ncbi:MAG TPA: rhodanese-like domain-containing protein [Candidatus Acidoferrales bacterium]|nr:rhodanese-like domain-containing protein [Candidatus Acidoferrales bacterium]